MDFDVEHFVRNLIIVLVSVTLCTATSESVMARFTENKNVATSHTTLQNVSDIQCVRKCNKERQRGMCTLAEYNKATKACYLSVDEPHAALDTADEMTGVFVLEPVPQSILYTAYFLFEHYDLKWVSMTYCLEYLKTNFNCCIIRSRLCLILLPLKILRLFCSFYIRGLFCQISSLYCKLYLS